MIPLQIGLLLGSGVLAGAINAVAGGGTFLTFPALTFAGLPAIDANMTSTVAVWPGSLASIPPYAHELAQRRRMAWILGLVSAAGGLTGALLLLRTPSATFAQLVPWLLLFATLTFAFGTRLLRALHRRTARTSSPRGVITTAAVMTTVTISPPAKNHSDAALFRAAAVQFPIAVYGGFFGAGAGILQLAVLDVLGLENIHAANAIKVIMSSAFNAPAVLTFILAGKVWWGFSLAVMTASMVGGYGGAWLAQRVPAIWVRRFVIAVGTCMTAYFFWNVYGRR